VLQAKANKNARLFFNEPIHPAMVGSGKKSIEMIL